MTLDAGPHGGVLTDVTLFRAAVDVRDHVAVDIRGQPYAVSPVSAGFVALDAKRLSSIYWLAADALRGGRPLAVVGDAADAAAALAADTGSTWIRPRHRDVHFVVPARFVRDRITAIRHRQPRRPAPADAPVQELAAVGIGPHPSGTQAEVRQVLARVEAVVATDWTYEVTLPRHPDLCVPDRAIRRVVPYDITDYDSTIAGFNDALDRLQHSGVTDVALLVEGNPDTYDVLDGICLDRRRLRVLPGVPIALVAAGDFARRLPGRNPYASQLAYLSGLPWRHQQTTTDLRTEVGRYLSARVPCVLVEMTFGDIDYLVRASQRATAPKTLALLVDSYSPHATELVADATSARETRALLEDAKGKLSTLLIFDTTE